MTCSLCISQTKNSPLKIHIPSRPRVGISFAPCCLLAWSRINLHQRWIIGPIFQRTVKFAASSATYPCILATLPARFKPSQVKEGSLLGLLAVSEIPIFKVFLQLNLETKGEQLEGWDWIVVDPIFENFN